VTTYHAAAPYDPAELDGQYPDLPDYDLGALAEKGIPPPRLICGDMLYAGMVHCLAGPPGGGKTTLLGHWLLQHLREGGNVMLLDEESGPELMAERMLDLGATPDELRPPRFTYVPFPARGWNQTDVAQLHRRLDERRPGVLAWDSASAFLTIADKDENNAGDVTRFWHRVLIPCARRYGPAVLTTDHTGKNPEHGGYGRGSGAKKAASDVQYMLDTITPYNREHDGVLKLTTHPGKDRRGWLAAAYRIHVTVRPVITLAITQAGDDETGGLARTRTPAQAKILAVLDTTPIAIPEIGDRLKNRFGHSLRRETISRSLNELLRMCDADRFDAPDKHTYLWALPAGF